MLECEQAMPAEISKAREMAELTFAGCVQGTSVPA